MTTASNDIKKSIDPTLAELWAIKDATARKYRNATEYFAHLTFVHAAQNTHKKSSAKVQPKLRSIVSKRPKQNALIA